LGEESVAWGEACKCFGGARGSGEC
jgi:hypothetical protein